MTTITLPETILDAARQRRGDGDDRAWDNADFVASVVAETTIKRSQRSSVLAQLAVAMGISRAQATDLYLLAERYEPAIRREYGDALTIGHYREAMRCQVHEAKAMLRWCIESADDYGGTPAGVDALRKHVRELNAAAQEPKTKAEQAAELLDRIVNMINDALGLVPVSQKRHLNAALAEVDKVEIK